MAAGHADEIANGGKDGALGLDGLMYYDDTHIGAGPGPMARLDDYDIDRYEVTNLQ